MTHEQLSGSGTSMRVTGIGNPSAASMPIESQKGSIAVTLTCHFVRVMLSAPWNSALGIASKLSDF